jgi:hypothetical protein
MYATVGLLIRLRKYRTTLAPSDPFKHLRAVRQISELYPRS